MKRVPISLALAAAASIILPPAALPGPNSNASILVHLLSPTTRPQCTRGVPACGSVLTHGGLYPNLYFAYLLVAGGDATAGLAGVQFGISYGSGRTDRVGVDIFSWMTCGDIHLYPDPPDWGESGSGMLVTWDSVNACQRNEPGGPGTGVVAAAGIFYLAAYSDAVFSIIPRPVDNLAIVASCSAVMDTLEGAGAWHHDPGRLGSVGFGGRTGYNPCLSGVPARPATWSGIKARGGGR